LPDGYCGAYEQVTFPVLLSQQMYASTRVQSIAAVADTDAGKRAMAPATSATPNELPAMKRARRFVMMILLSRFHVKVDCAARLGLSVKKHGRCHREFGSLDFISPFQM
jgi:hypothetical protein